MLPSLHLQCEWIPSDPIVSVPSVIDPQKRNVAGMRLGDSCFSFDSYIYAAIWFDLLC